MKKLNKRAQSTLEYAVLIGVLVAALIAMQTYLKRGYQGKLKEGADSMGEQFSPGRTTNNYQIVSDTDSKEEVLEDATTKTTINSQNTDKTGLAPEKVEKADQEWWPQ